MAFVKLVKSTPYFKRFQTKYRRRREGKTDYYARKRLIIQDKNKYNSPKYRFVPRITNSRIICQVIFPTIRGDEVLCAAESTELKRFGLKSGLTNYAAAYATGLLLARRLLKKLNMHETYKGVEKVDGALYDVSQHEQERRPFKAVLDVGLVRTTTGNRVFGCLKGASDGGLYIPHKEKRFPGYKASDEKAKYDAKVHRDRIFGVHVDKYLNSLKKEGDESVKRQFGRWTASLKEAGVDSIEKLFTKVQAEIRKNPDRVKSQEKKNPDRAHSKYHNKRLTKPQRKQRAQAKLKIALSERA